MNTDKDLTANLKGDKYKNSLWDSNFTQIELLCWAFKMASIGRFNL